MMSEATSSTDRIGPNAHEQGSSHSIYLKGPREVASKLGAEGTVGIFIARASLGKRATCVSGVFGH